MKTHIEEMVENRVKKIGNDIAFGLTPSNEAMVAIRELRKVLKKELIPLATQAHQAGIEEAVKIMESMKEDGETPFGHQELHETELAYNQALDDTIKALTDNK